MTSSPPSILSVTRTGTGHVPGRIGTSWRFPLVSWKWPDVADVTELPAGTRMPNAAGSLSPQQM